MCWEGHLHLHSSARGEGCCKTQEDKVEALRKRIFRSRQFLSKISCHFQVRPQQKEGEFMDLTHLESLGLCLAPVNIPSKGK